MVPKEFIQNVLIDGVSNLIFTHPYLSFLPMIVGIEFLGKCLNDKDDWNYFKRGKAHIDFELAIKTIPSLKKYEPYLESHKLHDSLRNGYCHSFLPKNKTIALSSGDESREFRINGSSRLNLHNEVLYYDFVLACQFIINKSDFENDKINKPILGSI